MVAADCAFFVHHEGDNVGVAVRDIAKGETTQGWVMQTDGMVSLQAVSDIPLGHKIALAPLAAGEKIVKYGYPIGLTTKAIARGEHVHTQNLKSARW